MELRNSPSDKFPHVRWGQAQALRYPALVLALEHEPEDGPGFEG